MVEIAFFTVGQFFDRMTRKSKLSHSKKCNLKNKTFKNVTFTMVFEKPYWVITMTQTQT